jgi:hypothetical protein
MNSHFTQVAQLQFEYIWTRQIDLDEQDMDQDDLKMTFDEWVWT